MIIQLFHSGPKYESVNYFIIITLSYDYSIISFGSQIWVSELFYNHYIILWLFNYFIQA